MKRIIFLLFTCLTLNLQINTVLSQPADEKPGFWIEIIDDNSQNLISKTFIHFEKIKNLPLDSALTTVKNEKTTQTWYGANLCELFETVDVSCEKIQKLSISAYDGYTSVLSGELLSYLKTAICAYKVQQDNEWSEEYGDMRLIFPDLRSMYWVNNPNKIVITIGENQSTLNQYQFYFLDNEKLSCLVKKDKNGNPCLVIDDLLFELNLPQNNFHVLTSDGLFREYPKNDINRYLLLQKQESGSWEINGINVPPGLKTREVFFISSGNKGIFLKDLTENEQQKWERIFWQPLLGENNSLAGLRIELVLNDNRIIQSKLTNQFREGIISLYRLFEEDRKKFVDLKFFMINWRGNQ